MFLKIKEIKEIVAKALIVRTLIFESENLNADEISILLKKVNVNTIPDDLLSLSDNLYPYIDWSTIEKYKVVRILARNKKIKDYIDLKRFNFTLKELLPCIKIHPDLITEFGFELKNLEKNEIVELLKTGRDFFVEKIEFDPEIFSATEAFLILKNFDFNAHLMDKFKLNEKKINPQYLRDIIIFTGEEQIDKFNLKILEPLDWINILRSDKSLIKYCDLNVFKRGDIFFLIEFVVLYPEYKDMISEENIPLITSLGWEKLLIKFGDEVVDMCDFSIITEVSWKKILSYRPALQVHKL